MGAGLTVLDKVTGRKRKAQSLPGRWSAGERACVMCGLGLGKGSVTGRVKDCRRKALIQGVAGRGPCQGWEEGEEQQQGPPSLYPGLTRVWVSSRSGCCCRCPVLPGRGDGGAGVGPRGHGEAGASQADGQGRPAGEVGWGMEPCLVSAEGIRAATWLSLRSASLAAEVFPLADL